ncbi:hypothetical protein ACI2JA_04035 [Alkalihalobacillus sp. NPDC078783]
MNRKPDESLTDYQIRLYMNLDNYGIDTHKATELLNKDAGQTFSESKWRKDYDQYKRWNEYIVSKNLDEEVMAKYEESKLQAEISKVQNADQKREYRKMIRHESRFQAIKNELTESIAELKKHKQIIHSLPSATSRSTKEGLVLFSDWHYGMVVESRFNTFNQEVFTKRVEKLTAKTIEYGKQNNIRKLHVAQLGDLLSGILHVSTRVQSNEDIIKQVTYVTEVLSEILAKFASEFEEVTLYNVIGNHGRTISNKNDVGMKENFEYLIPWYIQARLSHVSNLEIIQDEDGLIEARIMGEHVVFVHGNFDTVANSAKAIPQMLGVTPAHLFMGHIHHNVEKEHGTMTVTVNSSLIGVDDHAISKRLYSKPAQKMIIFDEHEGAENTYLIKLHNVG